MWRVTCHSAWHCVQVRVVVYAISCECVVAVKLLIRAFELTGLCVLANPVYQMCGAAVEPAGTGGAGR